MQVFVQQRGMKLTEVRGVVRLGVKSKHGHSGPKRVTLSHPGANSPADAISPKGQKCEC